MSEVLVLAELTIGADGVVKGFGVVNNAVGQAEDRMRRFGAQTRTTGDVFTSRMFSMRSAAVAFLGAFTVAGAIQGMKSFVSEVIRADAAFKGLQETTANVTRQFKELLGPFVRLGLTEAKIQVDLLGAGLAGLLEKFKNAHRSMSAGEKAAFWTILSLFGGPVAVAAAGGVVQELPRPQEFIGPPAPQGFGQFGRFAPTEPGGAEFFAPQAVKVDEATAALGELRSGVIEINAPLLELGDHSQRFMSMWEAFGEIYVEDVEPGFRGMNEQLDAAIAKYEEWANVIGAAYELIGSAAAAGILSQAAAAKAQAGLLAFEAVQRGMMELALAAAAAASFNYYSAAMHKVAAGLFFATAAFRGSAIFGSGGGGGGGGGGGPAQLAAPQEQSRGGMTIHFYNDNGVFVGDPNDFARWLTKLQRKQAADNA